MTQDEFDRLFEVDERQRFVRLIIPALKDFPEFNLIGKDPSEYKLEEIVRLKVYRREMRETIEK